jgi:hypothetical protein
MVWWWCVVGGGWLKGVGGRGDREWIPRAHAVILRKNTPSTSVCGVTRFVFQCQLEVEGQAQGQKRSVIYLLPLALTLLETPLHRTYNMGVSSADLVRRLMGLAEAEPSQHRLIELVLPIHPSIPRSCITLVGEREIIDEHGRMC